MISKLALYILVINIGSLLLFGWDKHCAQQGYRRISEMNLLRLACIGGTIGAYLGRSLFRHKTRKQPFGNRLRAIAGLQIGCAAILHGWANP